MAKVPDISRYVESELGEEAGLDLVNHFYYFSPGAHRAFDVAHYLGVPNLITKKLFGRWVLHPKQGKLFEPWYRRYYEEGPRPNGAYLFLHFRRARRASESGASGSV